MLFGKEYSCRLRDSRLMNSAGSTLLHELDIGLKGGGWGEALPETLIYEVCLKKDS